MLLIWIDIFFVLSSALWGKMTWESIFVSKSLHDYWRRGLIDSESGFGLASLR